MFLNTDNTTVREKEKKNSMWLLTRNNRHRYCHRFDYDRLWSIRRNKRRGYHRDNTLYAFNRVIRIIGESSAESYDYFVYNFLKLFLN